MVLGGIPFWLFTFFVIWLFAVELRILPPSGGMDMMEMLMAGAKPIDYVRNIIQHAILPVSVFILFGLGAWGLSMRANLITVLGEDYILFAHAKGLPERQVFLRYGVRNALLPVITGLALAIGRIISRQPDPGDVLFLSRHRQRRRRGDQRPGLICDQRRGVFHDL